MAYKIRKGYREHVIEEDITYREAEVIGREVFPHGKLHIIEGKMMYKVDTSHREAVTTAEFVARNKKLIGFFDHPQKAWNDYRSYEQRAIVDLLHISNQLDRLERRTSFYITENKRDESYNGDNPKCYPLDCLLCVERGGYTYYMESLLGV